MCVCVCVCVFPSLVHVLCWEVCVGCSFISGDSSCVNSSSGVLCVLLLMLHVHRPLEVVA